MLKWLRKLQGRRKPSDEAAPSPAVSPATPREAWTVPGGYFDSTGYQLAASSPSAMTWAGDKGGTLTLHYEPLAGTAHLPTDIDTVRCEHRSRAAATGGGIVSVDRVLMPDGREAIEAISKQHEGLGYSFEGRLIVPDARGTSVVRFVGAETPTGVREAMVLGEMIRACEIDHARLMAGEPDASGARRIPGLMVDPYDPAYDATTVAGQSDDPRIDFLFPGHPLTLIRRTLLQIRSTWVTDDALAPGPVTPDDRHALQHRGLLSDLVLREIYWIAGRNDLLEGELTAAISNAESSGGDSIELARLLTMLGLALHNSNNVARALGALTRAVRIQSELAGEVRETGFVLVLLGRTQHALGRYADAEPSFQRAIRILDHESDADLQMMNATSLLSLCLLHLGRGEEARPFIERSQQLMAGRGSPELAPLWVLLGGKPNEISSKMTVVGPAPADPDGRPAKGQRLM